MIFIILKVFYVCGGRFYIISFYYLKDKYEIFLVILGIIVKLYEKY